MGWTGMKDPRKCLIHFLFSLCVCPEISVNIHQRGLSFLCHGAPAKRTWFQRSALSMASFTLAHRFQWSRFTLRSELAPWIRCGMQTCAASTHQIIFLGPSFFCWDTPSYTTSCHCWSPKNLALCTETASQGQPKLWLVALQMKNGAGRCCL